MKIHFNNLRITFVLLCAFALNFFCFASVSDTAGRLLVSSHNTDEVFRYNETNGTFIDIMVSAGSGGLNAPHGLAFGPDRNLYVGSAGSDEVLRYHGETGAFIDAFVTNGSGGLDYPAGILFGPDGHLYVASQISDQILRYHGLTGEFIDAFVAAGSGGLNGPSVPVFGPDSNLYVTGRFDDRVYKYNGTNGNFINVFVTNQLSQPFGCAFGPDGQLYIASGNNHVIRRFDGVSGQYIDDFAASGMNFPVQFIFGPDTNIYACSFNNDTVQRFNGTNGVLLGAFVSAGNGLDGPNFLTFRPAGSGPLDRDGDGMPDFWEITYAEAGLLAGVSNSPLADYDGDNFTDVEEFVADTIPTDSNHYFFVQSFDVNESFRISFGFSTARVYGLHSSEDLVYSSWSNWVGGFSASLTGNIMTVTAPNHDETNRTFRVQVSLP